MEPSQIAALCTLVFIAGAVSSLLLSAALDWYERRTQERLRRKRLDELLYNKLLREEDSP